MGIFDQVFTQQVPFVHGRLYVVGMVEGESNSEHMITVKITNTTDNSVLVSIDMTIKLGPNGKSNIIAEVNNLQLSTQGIYTVECFENNEPLVKRNLIVQLVGPQYSLPGNKKLAN